MSLYESDTVVAPFIDSMIYIANCFHYKGARTQVLRDEDITFPPTSNNFDPASNKFVKPYATLVQQLTQAIEATSNLKVYLQVVKQLVVIIAFFLDPLEPLKG